MAKVIADHHGAMIDYTVEAETKEEVEDAIDRIERAYNPWGYGTAFWPPEQRADGSWICRGHRSSSCD